MTARSWRALVADPRISGAGNLAAAGLFSAALGLGTLPFLTRIYTPAVYAEYAIALAASTLLATVVSGRYEMACVVAPQTEAGDREAWKMARLALIVAGLACLFILVLGATASITHAVDPPTTALAIAPLTLLAAATTVQTLLDTRLGRYRLLALLNVARAVILYSVQIGLGLGHPTGLVLLIALGASQIPSVLRLGQLLVLQDRGRFHERYTSLARRHIRYPMYQTWAALANGLSLNLFVFAVAFAFGPTVVGLYAVANRLAQFPSTVLTQPVNTVYFGEVARVQSQKTMALRLYSRVVRSLTLGGVLTYALLAVATPFVVSLLGGEWAQSQPLIYASIPAGLALLLGAPANSTLIVFGRQRELLIWRLVIVFVGPALVFLSPVVGLTSTPSVFLASMSVLVVTALYAVRARGIIEQESDRPHS